MKVKDLIEHLKMFGDDADVLIQTTPDDLCQPIHRGLISLIKASYCDRYGLSPAKVLFTAFIPYDYKKKESE